MKLNEVLDFPVDPGSFEILNLQGYVDEEVFASLLKEKGLMLTYNGVELRKAEAFESILHRFFGMVREKYKAEVNKGWVLNFSTTLRAYYNWNNMCLYFVEEYTLKHSVSLSVKDFEVYQRISYTSTLKRFDFKILELDQYEAETKDSNDLIDLMKVL